MLENIGKEQLLAVAEEYGVTEEGGTAQFVYDRQMLEDVAAEFSATEMPYGFTPRYPIKANSDPGIIYLFDEQGLHFDASTAYETELLIDLGIEPEKISLSSQTRIGPFRDVTRKGVLPLATSLYQMDVMISVTTGLSQYCGAKSRVTFSAVFFCSSPS